MLKKGMVGVLLSLLLAAPVLAETSNPGFVFFPVTESSYQPNFVVAALKASVTADPYGHEDPTQTEVLKGSGAEISLDCPWFQFGSNPLRQQISVVNYIQQASQMTSLELNPHYVMTGGVFGLGFGPGFGWIRKTSRLDQTQEQTYFTLQYGVSLVMNLGFMHIAVEKRRQMSSQENGKFLDNQRQVLKLGIAF